MHSVSIVIVIFIAIFIFFAFFNKSNSDNKPNLITNKNDKIALRVVTIDENKNNEELINQVSGIINKDYTEVRNIFDFYKQHINKDNDTNIDEKFFNPSLAIYPTIKEAKLIRDKLAETGVRCSLAVTSDLIHDDKYNIDYELV